MRSRLPVRLPWRSPALWAALGVVVIGATAGTALAYTGHQTPAASQQTTVRVRRGVVELTASAAGSVQAAQSRGLSFSIGGTVTEVDVKPGDTVTPGQVLARIDSTSAQDDVNTAQASVNSASDALTRARQTAAPAAPAASNCQDGAVRAAPAAYVVADATTQSASASPTPTPSPASPQPVPSAHPTRGGTPSASATPKSGTSGRTSQSGSGGHSGTGTCTGNGGGNSSGGANGGGAGGGRSGSGDSLMSAEQQLTNAQLALQLAQDRLAGTTITAPVAGRVLSVAGTVGAQETPGGSGFIVLGDVADTVVQAEFSEADVAHLAVGQTATITLPDRDGAQVKGKVSQIDPAGTTSGRLVRYGVQVTFDQVPDGLLLGQSADVAVVTASAADVTYAPSAAVRSVSGGNGVVTVRSGGRNEQRTVRVGLRGDQYTEIRSGVAEGDELVVPGSR